LQIVERNLDDVAEKKIIPSMDRASLQLLEQARDRLIESIADLRASGGNEQLASVQEAMAHVLPNLPGLIAAKLPKAHAQIYTREQMQSFLAQFVVDLLAVQSDCLRIESERRKLRKPRR
jgi:hypothetical protein